MTPRGGEPPDIGRPFAERDACQQKISLYKLIFC